MSRPLNMNPEDYARQLLQEQQEYIAELEAELEAGGGGSGGDQPTNIVLQFSFASATTPPPMSNQVRLDNVAASATMVWAHQLTSDGIDIKNLVTVFKPGDHVYLQDKNDSTCYARFTLRADPIVQSTYVELPVDFVDAGGTLNGGQPAILALTKANV